MSFFELANFLKTQASGNEQLSLVFESLEKEIIKYTQLRAQELALHDEEFHLQMEARLLESFADHMEEHREQNNNISKEISELYDNFMKLITPLKKLDMKEVAANKVLVQEMKWQEEKKEIEEMHRQKREMLDGMENRNIVQKLRRTQKKYQESVERMQQAEEFRDTSLQHVREKLESALDQRNEIILNMVKNAKRLETVRREKFNSYEQYQMLNRLEEKKCELMKKLQHKQNQQICTSTTSSISIANTIQHKQPQQSYNILENLPTFDPRNPMAFLKSLNLDIDTDKIMQEFSLELKKEAEIDSEKRTDLRPISRAKPENVHFLESDSSCDSVSSSSILCTPSFPLECAKAVNSNLPISSTIESLENEEIINLLTPANDMYEHDEPDIEMSSKPQPVVEVLECKIIKSAGTALHKSIPLTLSPPTPIIEKEKQVVVAATISESFKVPQLPKHKNILKPSKQGNDVDTQSKPTKKTDKASGSEQSRKNISTGFSFESLLLSNKSLSSDSDNDLDFKTDIRTYSSADNFMIDFDSNVENTNVQNSDNDAFDINFSDSDDNPVAGRNNFDL